ncbi:YwqH-like family protein [Listeria booriae]|uniref:YwqH-like family protein n=1 Tax=Listeria booriae TaxID=1552123 RepID=UPI001625FE1F|nr:DUF5082 family protein [Listeria booriae]MBC2258781.1 DUF5082 domain-containing protein [Listeria booriae]
MSSEVYRLINQKSNYQASLGSLQNELSVLSEKRARLETAKRDLEGSIQTGNQTKQGFVSIVVEKSEWAGFKEKEYENLFNEIAIDKLNSFINMLQEVCDGLTGTIASIGNSIENKQSDIVYVQKQISVTDSQIANEKKKGVTE